MKAVLVIDEMPTECIECPLCRLFADDKLTETHCTWMATTNEDGITTRAEWCPLRPLPKKLNETEIVFGEIHGYRGGWNDCLDEILGETE